MGTCDVPWWANSVVSCRKVFLSPQHVNQGTTINNSILFIRVYLACNVFNYTMRAQSPRNAHLRTVELGYNVIEGTEHIVSLQTGVALSEVYGKIEGVSL
jgi:hypothetical protein